MAAEFGSRTTSEMPCPFGQEVVFPRKILPKISQRHGLHRIAAYAQSPQNP